MNMLRSTSRINGTNIFYEMVGDGYPLILIHSEFTDHRIWDFQIKEFAKHFQVVRYDLRGFGKSDSPVEPISFHEDLFELMNFLNIQKAYLLGVSLGAEIAIDFTIKYPEMVEALVLSGPSLSGYKEELHSEESIKNYEAAQSIIKKDERYEESLDYLLNSSIWKQESKFIHSYLKDIFKEASLEWMLNNYINTLEPPAVYRLSEIKLPTLIIKGERDSKHNLDVAKILELNINNLRVEIIDGTGKLANLDKYIIFNQLVLDFLLKL
ncbi:MAG: alpha/beta fold hydrolase [Vulcanibacillus sp.]